jgi:hypothetical protein
MSLSVGQLEALLRESTDGFLDDSERPDDLRMTLRITLDIHKFFLSGNSEPDASTISYAMGTIQSGIDEFVLIAYTCRCFVGLAESWVTDRYLPSAFDEFRSAFLRAFDRLIDAQSAPVDRVTSLLSLLRIQLAFFAWYFPWGEATPGSLQPGEGAE